MTACSQCCRPLSEHALAERRDAHLLCLPGVRRALARLRAAMDRGDLIGADLDEIRGMVRLLLAEEDQ